MSDAVFELPFTVRTFDVGPAGLATPAALLRCFQEAAALHANGWGWGGETLAARGRAWVLARLAVRFHRFPVWQSELTVTTWSRGPGRLFFTRDFTIETARGEPVAAGTSAFLLIDLRSRRPQPASRVDPAEFGVPHYPERKGLAEDLLGEALPPLAGADAAVHTRRAYASDMDQNGHVNNTRLIDFALDMFDETPRLVVANFLAEVRAGDEVGVVREGSEVGIEVRGKVACRVRVG